MGLGSLDEPLAKWRWANDHIQSLQSEIGAFFDGDNYAVTTQFDEKTDYHILRVQIREDAPLERWGLIVGDILHNLRTCLNYVVYQLAVRGSSLDPPPDAGSLQFPIFIKEHGNHGYDSKAPKQIANIPGGAAALIKDLQPFGKADADLWVLRELSNADKHKTLTLTVAFLRSFSAWDSKTVGVLTAMSTVGYVHPDTGERIVHDLYDDMELSKGKFGPDDVNRAADVQTDAAFDVIFGEGPAPSLKNQVVTTKLLSLAEAVGDVLNTFKPFLT